MIAPVDLLRKIETAWRSESPRGASLAYWEELVNAFGRDQAEKLLFMYCQACFCESQYDANRMCDAITWRIDAEREAPDDDE